MERSKCLSCDKNFNRPYALKRHLRNVHQLQEENENVKSRIICPVEECAKAFNRNVQFREHLSSIHEVNVHVEELEFDSNEDFEKWRTTMQEETCSEYIRGCTTRVLGDGYKKVYYHCNRSYHGHCLSPTERKRALKSKGSKKTGFACPSSIELKLKDNDKCGNIFVKFWQTHYGHYHDVGHLRIDKNTRNEIAGKLRSGVSFETVLESIRQTTTENISKRSMLIGRQDLHNICRDYHIDYECEINPVFQLENSNNSATNCELDELRSATNCELDELRQKGKVILELLSSQTIDPDLFPEVERQLDNVIELLSSGGSNFIVKTPKNPTVNKTVEKQISFFSTTKKKSSEKTTVKNPTINEELSIVGGLKDTNKVIVNVHTENEHSYCNVLN